MDNVQEAKAGGAALGAGQGRKGAGLLTGRESVFRACTLRRVAEQLASLGDALVATAVGEKPIVPDFDQSGGKDVETEPAQELVEIERHGFRLGVVRVVLIGKGHGAGGGVEGEDAAVADGDAVGVARKIGEHLTGTGERALGINIPFGAAGLANQPVEGGGFGLGGHLAVEGEFVLPVKGHEAVAIFGAEDRGEGAHGKQITGMEVFPMKSVRGQSASGDDAMQVIMIEQVLSPGVQDHGDSGAHAQLVIGKLEQRRAGAIKEEFMECARVLPDECVEAVRQGEDDMEVGNRQKILFLALQPLVGVGSLAIGAMPVAARVRHQVFAAAVGAAIAMGSERGRAAAQDRIESFPDGSAKGLGLSQRGGDHLPHRRPPAFGGPAGGGRRHEPYCGKGSPSRSSSGLRTASSLSRLTCK